MCEMQSDAGVCVCVCVLRERRWLIYRLVTGVACRCRKVTAQDIIEDTRHSPRHTDEMRDPQRGLLKSTAGKQSVIKTICTGPIEPRPAVTLHISFPFSSLGRQQRNSFWTCGMPQQKYPPAMRLQ